MLSIPPIIAKPVEASDLRTSISAEWECRKGEEYLEWHEFQFAILPEFWLFVVLQ